jgi:hypothetical protein
MTQTTGGHHLDTGDGPAPLDHPVGRGIESPAITAYRAYIAHINTACGPCQKSVRACPEANGLWAAYSDSRHAS